ncbi:MAG: agmatinase [Gemmatimonadota bacterium]
MPENASVHFLDLPPEWRDPETARAAVLPIPYEATTSYARGTERGPRAILEASAQVEFYDLELDAEPCREGICTLEALRLPRDGAAMVDALRRAYDAVLADRRFVVALGGEHTITYPLVAAWADRLGQSSGLSVLQLDAHADLRDAYEGTPWSHACVMRRVVDAGVPVVGVGLRSLSAEEHAVMRETRQVAVLGPELGRTGWIDRILDGLGPKVYITFDVDFFDPSLVPATGTPEPGGGTWGQALALLRRVFAEREVVAADVVELAPIAGLHAPDFVVAKLVYKILGYGLVLGRPGAAG